MPELKTLTITVTGEAGSGKSALAQTIFNALVGRLDTVHSDKVTLDEALVSTRGYSELKIALNNALKEIDVIVITERSD